MATTIIFATIIQTVYQKEENPQVEWIESCYGINCINRAEPSEPLKDWGYSAKHCTKQYHVELKNNNNETVSEFNYLMGICKL